MNIKNFINMTTSNIFSFRFNFVPVSIFFTIFMLMWLGLSTFNSYETVDATNEEELIVESYRHQISHLTEVIPLKAHFYTESGDQHWADEYWQDKAELDIAFENAFEFLSEQNKKEILSFTKKSGDYLAKTEDQAFDLVEQGKIKQAQLLISSNNYNTQKKLYQDGINILDIDLQLLTEKMMDTEKQTVEENMQTGTIIITILIIGWFVLLFSLYKWKTALEKSKLQLSVHVEQVEKLNKKLDSQVEELTQSRETILSMVERAEKAEKMIRIQNGKLAQSNQELEEFASIASHDLQEPLRKISAFGHQLEIECGNELSKDAKDYLTRMSSATERMRSLINDLLSYSRVVRKGKPFTETDLNKTLEAVLSDLDIAIQEKHADLNIGNLVSIDADPSQVHQLFQNLISNALKFTRADITPEVRVYGNLSKSDPNLYEIIVEDNGIGIPEKHQQRIFEIFQRLHSRQQYEGTGIGLAVCQRIAIRHNGSIQVESEEGKGSRFIIQLPVKQAPEEEQSADDTFIPEESKVLPANNRPKVVPIAVNS